MKNSIYSNDFKLMILTLYKEGKTIPELSLDYDISQSSIYNWINELDKYSIEIDDLKYLNLKLEIINLKKENIILKNTVNKLGSILR